MLFKLEKKAQRNIELEQGILERLRVGKTQQNEEEEYLRLIGCDQSTNGCNSVLGKKANKMRKLDTCDDFEPFQNEDDSNDKNSSNAPAITYDQNGP